MFIKEVIIDGFKSYATRTILQGFDQQFNAITGLNGSGKSNILDAICFVLGISNLSQVRVSNLQELVYKQGQAGVTKASVTLVFDNTDKKGSPMGYEEFEEVTIARQVVIGGKNKYLINGKTVQQSQVTNLFHSVQLNVNNPHFLIMQGRITKVLNMKPPEILGMIEEAAGTRMFEHKKQSAQKTIEKKQLKVDEITTILTDEITPRLDTLRGQKTHYLKWSANEGEENRLKKFCVAYSYSKAEAKLNSSEQEKTELEENQAALQTAQREVEEEVAETEAKAKEVQALKDGKLEKDLKKASDAREELSKEMVQATSEMTNKRSALEAEVKALESAKKCEEESGAAVSAKEGAIEAQAKVVEAAEAAVNGAEAEHASLQKEYQDMCAGVATEKDDTRTLTDQIAELTAEASAADARAKQGTARIKHLKATAKSTEREMKAAEKQVSSLRKDRDAAQSRVDKAEQGLESLGYDKRQEEGLDGEREEEERAVDRLRETVDRLSAQVAGRLNFEYRDPERNFDRSRVKGMVAKLVQVKDPAHSTALEVAAGGKLYQVVVDNEGTGKLLLEQGRLKRRVTIIPLNKITPNPLKQNQLSRAADIAQRMNGNASCAIELVGYEDDLRGAMSYVFGSSIVCDSLDVAKEVAFDRGVRARTVTLDGDSFEPQGTLTGGSKSQLGVILGRLAELQSASRELGVHEERLRGVNDKIGRLSEASKKFAKLSNEVEIRKQELSLLAERLGQSSHSQLEQRLEETKKSLEEETKGVEDAKAAGVAAAQRYKEKEGKFQRVCWQLKSEEASFRQARENLLEDLDRRVKAAKGALGTASTALKKEQRHSKTLDMELEQLHEAGSSQAEQRTAAEKGVRDATVKVKRLEEVVSEKRSLFKEADAALNALKAEASEYDATLKGLRKTKDKATKVLRTAELELKKLNNKLKQFYEDRRQAERFVASMLADYPWIAEEKAYFGQGNSDYDFEAKDPGAAQDRLKRLQEEQASLSKKINKKVMGMIEKAETEYKELIHKKEVVEHDKKKIEDVIGELDQKKNQTLQTTWLKVNRDFGSIFSTLLPGTSAKLQPPEGETVMAGLEVKVAFGSVWKETLTELSGGQRSLLALSLILSLLLFKPAPMYILDEVDAALDLSHTQNIGTMLKTHFSASQFIVVSLKEGMFNNANVIFRTKFVDGISAVGRTVNRARNARGGGDAAAAGSLAGHNGGGNNKGRKRGKTSSIAAAGGSENSTNALVAS
ncbi:unnamed protein product [Pylaiella littoralis]